MHTGRWTKQLWLRITGWIVLVNGMMGCGRIDPPIMHPIQDSTTTPAGFTLTLASPLSCLAVGREATFDLTITNPNDTPRILDSGPLEMLITGRQNDWTPIERRWSSSANYPSTVRRVFGAGEVRHYSWQWPVEAMLDMHVSVQLGPGDSQDTTRPQSTRVELPPIAIGSISLDVGGYAGTIAVPCDEVLQTTEQTATSLSGTQPSLNDRDVSHAK